MVTVLLAHPSRLVRQALSRILSEERDISVIGEAASGKDVLLKSEKLTPDVIVVDSVMPGLNGMLAESSQKNSHPEFVVVPAKGKNSANHLSYEQGLVDLVRAIAAAGGDDLGRSKAAPAEGLSKLTTRERQILGFVADGMSNKTIANEADISERTVKYHISNILRKLELFSRTEAAVLYLRAGFANKS